MSRSLLSVILLSSALTHSALAQDGDGDGCLDALDANGACVSTNASFDPTSTLGASSEVGAYATVGPQMALGDNVVIAPRASIAGRATHPSNPLPVGDGVIIGRTSTVGFDADLAEGTVIGRSVTIGSDLQTGSDASIGYGVDIGDDVTLGANSTIGSLVTVGDHTSVGNLAVIARGTTLADSTSGDPAAIDGIIGPDVTVGASVEVQSGARVRKQANLADGATLEAGARVGRSATVGENATVRGRVAAGATVGDGATVESNATVARGATVCDGATVPNGSGVPADGLWPETGCTVQTSCESILLSGGSTGDGVYSIDPDGSGGDAPFDAYCDMTGGGWTLAMRVADNMNTFTFLSPYWTSTAVLNPTSLDPTVNQDAKYPSFVDSPAGEIRGCLRNISTGVYACKDYALPSTQTLLELFTNTPIGSRDTGQAYFFNESDAGEREWVTMWGRSFSEATNGFPNYQDTGINIDDDQSNYRTRIRFGLVINGQSNIYTADDAIGFGASAYFNNAVGGLVESPWRVSAGAAFNSSLVRTRGTIWVR